MSILKRTYQAICKELSINDKVGGNADKYCTVIGKRGKLTVWESENLHPGEQYMFQSEDGKYDLQTSCGRIEIKNDILTISTPENKNVYSFFFAKNLTKSLILK